MPLEALPAELVYLIIDQLARNVKDINSLLLTNRRLAMLATPVLAKIATSEEYVQEALYCAAASSNAGLVRLLVEEGKGVTVHRFDRRGILRGMPRLRADEIVEYVLEEGPNVMLKDTSSRFAKPWPALHWAVKNGRVGIAEMLLKQGADVHMQDWTFRRTAFEHLQWAGYGLTHDGDDIRVEKLARLMFKYHALPEGQPSSDGPLHRAAENGHRRVTRLLLNKGMHPNSPGFQTRTPLHLAAQGGHFKVSKMLLAGGALLEKRDSLRRTPLHLAVQNGYKRTTQLLLARGHRASLTDADGLDPIHYAACIGRQDIISLLMRYGAELRIEALWGRTSENINPQAIVLLLENLSASKVETCDFGEIPALNVAAGYSLSKLVRRLLRSGVNPGELDMNDPISPTALHIAAEEGSAAVASVLLDGGAPVDARSPTTLLTPLHLAASHSHAVCAILISRNAPVSAADICGRTPLHCAIKSQNLRSLLLLIAANADVDAPDHAQKTPLHLAVKYLPTAIPALIGKGADVNVTDWRGRTPLQIADLLENPGAVKLLRAAGGTGASATDLVRSMHRGWVRRMAKEVQRSHGRKRARSF